MAFCGGKDLGKKTNIPQTFTTDHLLFDISFSHQQQAAGLAGVLALGGQKLDWCEHSTKGRSSSGKAHLNLDMDGWSLSTDPFVGHSSCHLLLFASCPSAMCFRIQTLRWTPYCSGTEHLTLLSKSLICKSGKLFCSHSCWASKE